MQKTLVFLLWDFFKETDFYPITALSEMSAIILILSF